MKGLKMATEIRAAHRRSDGALVGAAAVILLSTFGAVVLENYTKIGPSLTVEAESGIVHSAAELALASLQQEQQCLADALYYEGRSEGVEGQKAIAEVILARTRSRHYSHTICGVVNQGAERIGKGCQFTFRCDGTMERPVEHKAFEQARHLAVRILAGVERLNGDTGNAIAYHTIDVSPVWSNTMLKTAEIGRHIFYRFAPRTKAVPEIETEIMPVAKIVPVSETQPASDSADGIIEGAWISEEVETDIQIAGAVSDGA